MFIFLEKNARDEQDEHDEQMNKKNGKNTMNEMITGDIRRKDFHDGCWCVASLAHWTAFYVVREMAQWAVLGPLGEGRYTPWEPCCGSWEQLEDELGERFGSVVTRWWVPAPLPSACLVCQDRRQVAVVSCPACGVPPVVPRKRRKNRVPSALLRQQQLL